MQSRILNRIATGSLALLAALAPGCASPRGGADGSRAVCTAHSCATRAPEIERTGTEARLPVPESKRDREYLGLREDKNSFVLADVQADVLVVDLFDFYCHVCQKTAPQVNSLYDLLQRKGHDAKIKVIGIGVGDSPLEVRTFQNKFQVPFPTMADRAKAVSGQLGVDKRPSLVVLKKQRNQFTAVLTHTGTIDDVNAMLDLILRAAER